tara:strand:- start:11347 stop:11460 length:114 start_codon:yes stop_codon:yes gene_type:complete
MVEYTVFGGLIRRSFIENCRARVIETQERIYIEAPDE